VIGIAVYPEHFSEFYQKISRGRDAFWLIRTDGEVLARFPDTSVENVSAPGGFAKAIAENAEEGHFEGRQTAASIDYLMGYQKVRGYDTYVVAGIDKASLAEEFRSRIIVQLAIGVPISLSLLALSLYALRRAETYRQEVARREAAESALKQGQRLEALGQLTGGVAHDFNNLLMVIQGSAQRIQRAYATDTRLARQLHAIEEAVKRGTTLTRQLLSFSRRQPQDAAVIDLRTKLPQIREMLQASLRGDIVVHTETAPGLWQVKVDSNELELALLNLAVNARDAMEGGGRLKVSAENVEPQQAPPGLSGEFVAIAVEDTGCGIPEAVIDRVFEPFFTTKEFGKGTGLGLSQVYGFARQSGGVAEVKSEVGRGTRITIYLPRTFEQDRPASVAEVEKSPNFSGKVLLVEDNEDVAEVTKGLLEELGFSVERIADAETALRRLQSADRKYELLLSDIVMPGSINGLELARRARSLVGEQFPIVLATGYSAQAQAASEDGFVLLRKPYGMSDLRAAVLSVNRASVVVLDEVREAKK
jgi:two-component system NtrC family sensor kinase